MTEITTQPTRHGPKPGLKKPQVRKVAPQLLTRSLPDFPKLKALQPILAVIKVHHPTKHHRLVWQFLGRSFLCKENQVKYQKVHGKGGVLEAGETLGKLLGVKFK